MCTTGLNDAFCPQTVLVGFLNIIKKLLVIMFKEMTTVYSDNHMKPTNTFCVINSGLHNVKTDLCNSDMLFSLR
jgi:hypothetical protein